MNPEHRRKLRDPEMVRALTRAIDFDVLAPGLQRKGVLTAAMVDDIREKESLHERNLCLLRRLPRRGPLAYDRFVALLRENPMPQAVFLLTRRELLLSPSSYKIRSFGGWEARVVDTSAQNAGQETLAEASDAELRVTQANRWKCGDHIYRMAHISRGPCIIINNKEFGSHAPQREGSELDVYRMKVLFTALHFVCTVYTDLCVSEMKALLAQAAHQEQQQQQQVDCLVVILMSHGIQDVIYGVDGEQLDLNRDVYQLFSNENCPSLQGKPKLFFVQSSRGGKLDGGVGSMGLDATNDYSVMARLACGPLAGGECRRTSWSDMFIAYATVPGYMALKNRVTGSWFLSAVYTVFSEHACTLHLEKLMRLVQNRVLQRSSHDGARQTACVELVGWVKKLYFNPGLCATSRQE